MLIDTPQSVCLKWVFERILLHELIWTTLQGDFFKGFSYCSGKIVFWLCFLEKGFTPLCVPSWGSLAAKSGAPKESLSYVYASSKVQSPPLVNLYYAGSKPLIDSSSLRPYDWWFFALPVYYVLISLIDFLFPPLLMWCYMAVKHTHTSEIIVGASASHFFFRHKSNQGPT